jgi:hypothetical protein
MSPDAYTDADSHGAVTRGQLSTGVYHLDETLTLLHAEEVASLIAKRQ